MEVADATLISAWRLQLATRTTLLAIAMLETAYAIMYFSAFNILHDMSPINWLGLMHVVFILFLGGMCFEKDLARCARFLAAAGALFVVLDGIFVFAIRFVEMKQVVKTNHHKEHIKTVLFVFQTLWWVDDFVILGLAVYLSYLIGNLSLRTFYYALDQLQLTYLRPAFKSYIDEPENCKQLVSADDHEGLQFGVGADTESTIEELVIAWRLGRFVKAALLAMTMLEIGMCAVYFMLFNVLDDNSPINWFQATHLLLILAMIYVLFETNIDRGVKLLALFALVLFFFDGVFLFAIRLQEFKSVAAGNGYKHDVKLLMLEMQSIFFVDDFLVLMLVLLVSREVNNNTVRTIYLNLRKLEPVYLKIAFYLFITDTVALNRVLASLYGEGGQVPHSPPIEDVKGVVLPKVEQPLMTLTNANYRTVTDSAAKRAEARSRWT